MFIVLLAANVPAATHYVDANCTNPVSPYTDWSAAATNIQDAIDVSTNGDLVLVTNGVYQYGSHSYDGLNRVYIPGNMIVQSVNGPNVTAIMGYQVPGTTNGSTAIRCVYLSSGSTLSGFTLTNGATQSGGQGNGGGVWCQSTSVTVNNCIICGNASALYGGGVYSGSLINSLIFNNTSAFGGGGYGGTYSNCTIVANEASQRGGGVYGNTVARLYNSIIYFNTVSGSGSQGVFPNLIGVYSFAYCCTTIVAGPTLGNITNQPAFVSLSDGNYHLLPNSPCINAGNNPYVTSNTDLDGNLRTMGGTVDIGAYEFQAQVTGTFDAWLLQYGLPTNGLADNVDSDGTGMVNWQKWLAGLNPTNPASVLALQAPAATNNSVGITVTWQSVNSRTYYLQRSSDLTQPFSAIQSNLVGQTGTTSYTDTTATNSGPYFYRVGVQ